MQSRSAAGGRDAASEPLTVTALEHQLRELGLSDADISELTPDEVHNLLKQGPSPQAGELKPVYSSPDRPKRRRRRNRMQRWLDHVQATDDPQGRLILAMRSDPDMREFESLDGMANYFRGLKARFYGPIASFENLMATLPGVWQRYQEWLKESSPPQDSRFRVIDACEDSTVCLKCGQPGDVKRIKDSTRQGSQSETLHEACARAWFDETV